MNTTNYGGPILWNTTFQYPGVFLAGARGQLRVLAQRGAPRSYPSHAHPGHHLGTLRDLHGRPEPADQTDPPRGLPSGGDTESGDPKATQPVRNPAAIGALTGVD